jgi:hypothetical protein
MELSIRHIGANKQASGIIELTVTDGGTTLTVDVTDLNSKVDENFIDSLRDIANDLEEQNRLLNI